MRIRSFLFMLLAAALSFGASPPAALAAGMAPLFTYTAGPPQRIVPERSIMNMGGFGEPDYSTINYFIIGPNAVSPFGSAFTTSSCIWNTAMLDSNGWPNTSIISGSGACNGQGFGGGLLLASSADFSGQYTFDSNCEASAGCGSGTIQFNIPGTMVRSTGVSCGGVPSGTSPNSTGNGWGITSLSGNTVSFVDSGNSYCLPFTVTGLSTWTLGNWDVLSDDPSSTGKYIKNLRWYQQRDYARMVSGCPGFTPTGGCIFRAEWLAQYVTLNPGAIRFMNWGPGSAGGNWSSFLHRTLPTTGGISGSYWLNSPPYTVSSGTNFLTVASATGMPVSMTQGELVNFLISNDSVDTGTQRLVVGAISNANPGVVTIDATNQNFPTWAGGTTYCLNCSVLGSDNNVYTSVVTSNVGHNPVGDGGVHWIQQLPYNNGDVVILTDSANTYNFGMPKLNLYPVCVASVTDTTFALKVFNQSTWACTGTNVDTTTWGSYLGDGHAAATQFLSANIGARGNFPIVTGDGVTGINFFDYGPTLNHGVYGQLVFDKQSAGMTDGNGNPVYGAWITVSLGAQFGLMGPPLEIETELINEINALLPGGDNPTDMWINIPGYAITPDSPDYTSSNDFPANMVDTVINGANGYAGLCQHCKVHIEYWNETWGGTPSDTGYGSRKGVLRWGTAVGAADENTWPTLKSILSYQDIVNNSTTYATNKSRIKFSPMGGINGGDPGTFNGGTATSQNNVRYFGSTVMFTNTGINCWGSSCSGAQLWPTSACPFPFNCFDEFGYAPYLDATAAWYGANFATVAADWFANTGNPPAQAADIQTFIDAVISSSTTGACLCTVDDQKVVSGQFLATTNATGKVFVNYEGGPNWGTAVGGTPTNNGGISLTTNQSAFMVAVYQSSQMATMLQGYCSFIYSNSNGGLCAPMYLPINSFDYRWTWLNPDPFGSGSTEGGGYTPSYTAIATQNTGAP